jgi:hypothetical protein
MIALRLVGVKSSLRHGKDAYSWNKVSFEV